MISQIIKAVLPQRLKLKLGHYSYTAKKQYQQDTLDRIPGTQTPATPMQTDNMMALGVVNQNVMKKIKSDGHEIWNTR